MRTGADNSGSWLSFLVDGHLADRCGQVWFLGILSWRTFGGQVRTAEDKSGSLVSLIVGRDLADRWGQVRTGADNSGSWLSFLGRILDRHLGDSWISGGHLYHLWT